MPSLQIRNVPDDLHRTLKARAARQGQSLSEYLLTELQSSAAKPTIAELAERIRLREPVGPIPSLADLVREDRDAR